ncbi:hypothetical protein [Phascolarctobacterium sp.]
MLALVRRTKLTIIQREYGKAFFAKLFAAMQKATVSRAFAKRAPFLLLLSGTKEVNPKKKAKPKISSQPSKKSKISQKSPLILPEITLSGGALLHFLGYTIGVNNQLQSRRQEAEGLIC